MAIAEMKYLYSLTLETILPIPASHMDPTVSFVPTVTTVPTVHSIPKFSNVPNVPISYSAPAVLCTLLQ